MNKQPTHPNPPVSQLPLLALREIPTPDANAASIVALVKQGGRITGYKLSDGRVLSKEEAVQFARKGGIRGVGIAQRNGTEYLKAIPDSAEANNLSNLPSITQ